MVLVRHSPAAYVATHKLGFSFVCFSTTFGAMIFRASIGSFEEAQAAERAAFQAIGILGERPQPRPDGQECKRLADNLSAAISAREASQGREAAR